jgi:hypothetical protein
MASITEVKQVVANRDGTFEEDDICYRATAPHGFCWEPGLHELVANFGRMDMTKAQARQDLIERVKMFSPLPCIDPDCDWCK